RFMFMSGFSLYAAGMVMVDSEHDGHQYVSLSTFQYIDLLLLGTSILLCSVGGASHSVRKRNGDHARTPLNKPILPERENIWKSERIEAHLDVSSSANRCDSGTHHHTDPKSDGEDDENTSLLSQRPPRPGIKSIRKKRKRTERARKKEQREKLEEKNRKKPIELSLYQFIKEEVFHIRKNRQMRKHRPKKVERGPVFKPVRRPTPPPPKNAFCMRPKNKKSHLLKYTTSTVEDEMFQTRMQNRFKEQQKREMEAAHSTISPSSTISSSPCSRKNDSGCSDQSFRDAFLILAQQEGITNEECEDLYEREVMLLNHHHPSDERSKNIRSLRKRLVNEVRKFTESNRLSDAKFQSDSSNAAKLADMEEVTKPLDKTAKTIKQIPSNNNAKVTADNSELKNKASSK
uniref:Uncharacterized protein n=1 Tax=Parascaris univalens TaxID=6257 RepID=A0A915BJR9_PARUN